MNALRFCLVVLLVFSSTDSKAQARITMTGSTKMTFDWACFLVIDNPNPNAINILGANNGIISEEEDCKIRWVVDTATGSYRLPFMTAAPNFHKIPLDYTITSGTSQIGHVDFSTYPTVTNTGNAPWPSPVVCLNFEWSACAGYPNQHQFNRRETVFCRFGGLTPTIALTLVATASFSFPNSETAANNTINIAGMKAYRYDHKQWRLAWV